MHNPETTLIIILAVAFLILIILSLVVVYLIIRILQNIHNVTEKVSSTADNIPDLVRMLGKRLAPVAFSTLVGALVKKAHNKRKAREDDDE